MALETIYTVAEPEVVAEDFGGEIVVLNLLNGKYFSLLDLSADLWRDLAAGHRPRDLVAIAADRSAELAAAVENVARTLIAEGLLRPAGSDAELPGQRPSAAGALTVAASLPIVESFSDMAELILADPIHDVDEDRGWPVRRDPA